MSLISISGAVEFSGLVKIFIELHPDFEQIRPYYKGNRDTITIAYPDKRETKLTCYSADPDNARGFKADRIVVDESAYARTDLMLGLVIPILKNEMKSMLCISTPARGSNVHRDATKMLDSDGNENRYFTLELLPICKTCANSKHPKLCPHGSVGDVASTDKMEEYRPLYAKSGNITLFNQEMYGIDADNPDERPWYPDLLNNFFNPDDWVTNLNPADIEWGIIGVDTPGTGHMGRLAMMFIVRLVGGRYVVCAALEKNLETTSGTAEKEVKTFLRAIRTQRMFVNIPLVFAVEAAMNWTNVNKFISDLKDDVFENPSSGNPIPLRPFVQMKEYHSGLIHRRRAAVSIHGDRKWDMFDESRAAMASGRISILHPKLFVVMGGTLNSNAEYAPFTPMTFFEHWREQFEGVDERTKIPNDLDFGVVKTVISKGSVGDDSVMAFMHSIYWGGEIFYRKRTDLEYVKLGSVIRARQRALRGE